MTTTIVAEVVSAGGEALWYWEGRSGHRYTDRIQCHPAASFDDHQPGPIDITLQHDGPVIGQVNYLESGLGYGDGGVFAVGVLPDLEPDQIEGLYTSADVRCMMANELVSERTRLLDLAVVAETAGLAAKPIRAWKGDFRRRYELADWPRHTTPQILYRAAKAAPSPYSYQRTVPIHRPPPFTPRTGPMGPMRYSDGGRILAIR